MIVTPAVHVYTKTRNHRKNNDEKRKEKQPTENHINTIYQNISEVEGRFVLTSQKFASVAMTEL